MTKCEYPGCENEVLTTEIQIQLEDGTKPNYCAVCCYNFILTGLGMRCID